ncbi:glycoside hydrolase family protein [Paraburkholderia caballeronis]|uniref:glycoside hydrolase family protein n=1 Tax=Paraburkholderia caballeronis TaxID=416943 RepID=UPI0010649619|nr:glycoside hydrolase family protein [Paraburkholderia caballeronis]TDV04698.1 lysozyme [Paraburkholderia caballeronis]TDV07941.1 lysozyme [Paraburkholderia caballeronis]TDV18232.1 lysozyme [Paraburkholderia caballeronis]
MNLDLLEAELRRDEGVFYRPYDDPLGVLSVGVGHNLQVAPLPAGWTYPLTDAQVDELLSADIAATLQQLDARLPWWRSLDEVRQRVLANMAFNLGIAGLLAFRKMLAAVQAGNWNTAAYEMRNSKWFSQVGDRAKRLYTAMKTGVMPDEPVVT